MPPSCTLSELLALALETGLSAHDAACLELAVRSGCPLVTVDRALAPAAEAAGVEVLSTHRAGDQR